MFEKKHNLNKLLILGANNPEVIRLFERFQKVNPNWKLEGFLDNDPQKQNKKFGGYDILGGSKLVLEEKFRDYFVVNAITRDVTTRKSTTNELLRYGAKFMNLIDPDIILRYVDIGIGLYLQEGVILQAGVKVDNYVAIHLGSKIAHETRIGKYCFIANGCNVGGKVEIEDEVFVGAGALILPRLKIGTGAQVGAGSVVMKNVDPFTVVLGNPARVIRKINYKD